MQLGFLTNNVADIEKAARLGFDAVELLAPAFGDLARGAADAACVAQAKKARDAHGVAITAVAFYETAWAPPAAANFTATYARIFDLAEALGVRTVATMSGFDATRDWGGNIQLWADRFGPVAGLAEERGLRVAFENWMGCTGPLPHRPCNLGGSPDTWDAMFAAVPSRALGIEFDPSHLFWQGIDHLRALREYRDRVFHVHAKDTELLPEARYRGGINADAYRFRIPGCGDIHWGKFIGALDEIGYAGGVAIEHEDPFYTGARFDEGLVRGLATLAPLVRPGSGHR